MTPGASATPVPAALLHALDAFAESPAVLVALDFDGTLAPLVDDPALARPLPATARAVARLERAPGVTVAMVSGRPLDALIAYGGPAPETMLVGSHGAELRIGGRVVHPALDDDQRKLLDALGEELDARAAGTPGALVERKPAGVVFHTRTAGREDAARARAAIEPLRARPGVFYRAGKDVDEFSVVGADKGVGLGLLRDAAHPDRVLYAGDDLTDEDAFAVLGPDDVGIKVGEGPSAAPFRVADPAGLAAALDALADRRA